MLKRSEYMRQPIAVAMSLTEGRQNEAMLLFAIWDFFPYSKVVSKGMKVLILTDRQLSERTGLSFDQVRRAKRRLQAWKYLRTWVEESPNFHHGLTVTHIHVSDGLMSLIENLIKATMQICTVGNEQNRIDQYVQGCPLALYIRVISKNKGEAVPTKNQDFSAHEKQQAINIKEMFGHE